MPGEIHNLEQSLRGFLIEAHSPNQASDVANIIKYNNLKLLMEPEENKDPHVIIRIGISEAMYSLDTMERISGGLGSEERLVRRWLERTLINADLNLAWYSAKRVKPVTMKEDIDD